MSKSRSRTEDSLRIKRSRFEDLLGRRMSVDVSRPEDQAVDVAGCTTDALARISLVVGQTSGSKVTLNIAIGTHSTEIIIL